ncbi:MAG TPA: hypothetical protein VF812_14400 [Ktedonobacterales bacterium]
MEETIDELFPAIADAVRAILGELRTVVRAAIPDATELFYHGALEYGQTPRPSTFYSTLNRGTAMFTLASTRA